jgi:hypothetical protein
MQGTPTMAVPTTDQSNGAGGLTTKFRRGRRWRFAVVFGGLVVTAFAGWLAWCKFTEPPEPMLAGVRASEVFPLWRKPGGAYPSRKAVQITAEALPWMLEHVMRDDPTGARLMLWTSERLPAGVKGSWPQAVSQETRRHQFAFNGLPNSIRTGRFSWTNLSVECVGLTKRYPVDAAGLPLVLMSMSPSPDEDYRAARSQSIGLLDSPLPSTKFTVAKVALEYANLIWPDNEDHLRVESDRAEIRRVLAAVSGWAPTEWSLTETYVMCVVVARNRKLVLPGQFETFLGRVESGGLEVRVLAELTRQLLASEAGVPAWVRRTIDGGNSMAIHLAVRFLHDVGTEGPGGGIGLTELAGQWARVLAAPPSTGSWRGSGEIWEGRLSVKSFSIVAESMDTDPDRIVLLSQVLESLARMGPFAEPAREEIGRYRRDTRKEVADMAEAAWNRLW